MSRFIDASVFLYAYLRPARRLPASVVITKRNARSILKRVSEGESVVTSIVHISEVSNILEARIELDEALNIVSSILALPNLKIEEPTRRLYAASVETARVNDVGLNDALAWLLMVNLGINEVYSFDTDFDKIEGLNRIKE
jgi:predicted nucleic acid-binding protein